MEKTAIMAIEPRNHLTFTYKREPIHVMQSFKYIGINVQSTNRWHGFYESRLQMDWNSYYMLEKQ